jgi:hypothetical protein
MFTPNTSNICRISEEVDSLDGQVEILPGPTLQDGRDFQAEAEVVSNIFLFIS